MSSDENRRGLIQIERIKAKLAEARKKQSDKKNPLLVNPPAIQGEQHKHVTWGNSKNRDQPPGKHRKSDR